MDIDVVCKLNIPNFPSFGPNKTQSENKNVKIKLDSDFFLFFFEFRAWFWKRLCPNLPIVPCFSSFFFSRFRLKKLKSTCKKVFSLLSCFFEFRTNPVNYKSAIDEPGINQFAVSFKSTHCSLPMFISFCFALFSFVQRYNFPHYFNMNSSTVFVWERIKKHLFPKNVRHFWDMLEIWSFTGTQVERFRIIVVKNSHSSFIGVRRWMHLQKVFLIPQLPRHFQSEINHI